MQWEEMPKWKTQIGNLHGVWNADDLVRASGTGTGTGTMRSITKHTS